MQVTAKRSLFGGVSYTASIKQKGVTVKQSGKTYKEAITRCLQEYVCCLKG
jgi:hypothetical protein